MNRDRKAIEDTLRRIQKLPHSILGGELANEATLFELSGSKVIGSLVERRLDSLDADLRECPFLPGNDNSGFPPGEIALGEPGKSPAVSLGSGLAGFQHGLLAGQTGTGKTYLLAHLARQFAKVADVVLVDSQGQFGRFPGVRERFAFISVREQLRINPFDLIPDSGLTAEEQDFLKVKSMAECFSWQLGQQEANLAVAELRKSGSVNLYSLVELLKGKKYPFNTNRARFRDTVVLSLEPLCVSTHPLFDCEKGMDLRAVLTQGAVVLQIGSFLAEYQVYLLRVLLDYVYLLRRAGKALQRPLVLMIDEAQTLLSHRAISDLLLTLRHSQIHLIVGVQNPSNVCKEVLNNCDLFLALGLVDARDRKAISEALNLSREQAEYLPILPKRKAVCFMPHSSALQFARLIDLPFVSSDNGGSVKRPPFLDVLEWKERKEHGQEAGTGTAAAESAGGMDQATERLLRDVLNQAHEASPLTARFERAGIRSANRQGQIIRELCSKGYIGVYSLAVGRGRPLKLVEPTAKAFEQFGVKWKKKSRGALPTRVATSLLEQKFKKLAGWTCVREGELSYEGATKQVDFLLHDSAGRKVTLEVAGLSGGHESHNALHCLRTGSEAEGGVRLHVVVCLNKAVLVEVKEKFEGHSELAGNPRIELVLLSQALKEDWLP